MACGSHAWRNDTVSACLGVGDCNSTSTDVQTPWFADLIIAPGNRRPCRLLDSIETEKGKRSLFYIFRVTPRQLRGKNRYALAIRCPEFKRRDHGQRQIIDQHSDEVKLRAKKERGKNRNRWRPTPLRAMAIHEHIRRDGEKELERDAMALLWSAIAAGLIDRRFATGKGIFHVELEGVPGSFLLENLSYTFGFIIVIMARQQLFTENTVTAVTTRHAKPTMSNVGLLMHGYGASCCWVILLRTGIAAWAFEYMPIFNEETRDAFVKIGMDVMKNTPKRDVCQRDYFGWLIILWYGCFLQQIAARFNGDYIDDTAYTGDTTHIVVSSVEILYLVFNGTLHWSDFVWPFALPTGREHLRQHLYLRVNESCTDSANDMSNKAQSEARQKKQNVRKH